MHHGLALVYEGLLTHLPAELLGSAIIGCMAAAAKALKRRGGK